MMRSVCIAKLVERQLDQNLCISREQEELFSASSFLTTSGWESYSKKQPEVNVMTCDDEEKLVEESRSKSARYRAEKDEDEVDDWDDKWD